MKRILYALAKGAKHRRQLGKFLFDKSLQIAQLESLTVEQLEKANVAVLVLDFDGVLAPHDTDVPTPSAQAWLGAMSRGLGEQRIAILTNKAKPARIQFFKTNFPGIQVITGVAKKPYPDGLWEIANYRGIESSRLMLIDDRLLTGMLAASIAPCQARYFIKPTQSYRKHFFKESFFSLLRGTERLIFRLFG